VQHRETETDRNDAVWEWTSESRERIEQWLSKFPPSGKQSAVIGLLYVAQEQNDNWLSLAAMNAVAKVLDMAPIRVYEVATFYSMFNRQPVGKFHLQVCGTTPCALCGADAIISKLEKHLGIHKGGTTADRMFTLSEVECLGACVNAPMMQVNNKEFYEYLTEDNVVALVNNLAKGNAVKTNNQNKVFTCEGPQGQTTLLTPLDQLPPVADICRDFDKVREDLKAAAAAAAAQKKA